VQDLKESEGYPSPREVLSVFDSWNDAKQAAGLETYTKEGREKTYTDKELLNLLRELDERVDGPVTRKDVQEADDVPSRMTYRRHFGSWNDAKEQAGIETEERSGTPYTDEELLDKLRAFAKESNGPVTSRKIDEADGYPALRTYVRRFGSWSKAKQEAGID
jgi:hypothetical protein